MGRRGAGVSRPGSWGLLPAPPRMDGACAVRGAGGRGKGSFLRSGDFAAGKKRKLPSVAACGPCHDECPAQKVKQGLTGHGWKEI
jgi:hypothetical protein